MYHYKTHGTCSSEIELEIQNGIITHCKFIGGCNHDTAHRLLRGLEVRMKAR